MEKLIILLCMLVALNAQAQNTLSGYEWWVDNNQENATFQTLSPLKELKGALAVNMKGISAGKHDFYIRFKDSKGVWSVVQHQKIVKTPAGSDSTLVMGVEYWTDSTASRRFDKFITPIDSANTLVKLNLKNVSNGRHKLYLRFIDTNGQWSPIMVRNIIKTPTGDSSACVVACEYWIDGAYTTRALKIFNNHKPILETSFPLDLSKLRVGGHLLSLRFIDNTGNMSQVYRHFVYKLPIGQSKNVVSGYRYWFNNKLATLTNVALPEAQNSENTVLSIPLTQFKKNDTVIISLQFKDIVGQWSGIVSDSIKIGNYSGINTYSLANSKELILYPNPASNKVTMELMVDKPIKHFSFSIANLEGKTIIKQTPANNLSQPYEIDIHQLSAGIYIVNAEADGTTYSRKLIVK